MTDAPTLEVQPCGFLLELSADWLIMRASENAHRFLGEYHVTLVGRPLADFTLNQPLHDLRNSLSRQLSASGIARAYRVRLIDEPRHFDIAFQLREGRILLEGLPSAADGLGNALGSVSRLIEGLRGGDDQRLIENAARRLRALTGFDRATVRLNTAGISAESSRSPLPPLALEQFSLPSVVADARAAPSPVFPRDAASGTNGFALLRSPTPTLRDSMQRAGIRSLISGALVRDGEAIGTYVCDNRAAVTPSLELHAAAELFAQFVAMQVR